MESDDTARFLAGSPERRRLLAHLAEHPGSPAELAEELSLSRRSVQRHLGQFVDRGWAHRADGAYRLTVTGELVVEEHAAYLDALDHVESFGEFFAHLPDREHAPEPRWLDAATLATATPETPQAPVRHYLDGVGEFETERVRMLSPVLSRQFHDAHAELALEGVHTELVMSADTVKRARELNPGEFELVVGVDVLDLYRHPGDVPVGLTLGDERLLVGAYADDGQLRACVASAHPEFYRWGERLFERYRDRAEPVEPSFSLPFGLDRRR